MSIHERIKQLRENAGMSQQELAEKVGYKTASAVNKIEFGLRDLNQDRIVKFARALNTTEEYLINGESEMSVKGVKIPVLGYVRAGVPVCAVEEILDYEEISESMNRKGDIFALKIKGDSMEPRIREGDVVIVRQQSTVENGDIAVVLIGDEDAAIKKFYRTDAGIKLISFNPTYDPFFYTPEEVNTLPVQIIGKVIELRAKF